MNIYNIDSSIITKSYEFYKDPHVQKFVDLYYLNNKKTKYKLFYYYIFRIDIIFNEITKTDKYYDNSWIIGYKKYEKTLLTKNNNINFKNPIVKYQIRNNKVLFIGNTIFNNKCCPIFLSISNFYKNQYKINGFTIDNGDSYYFTNYKQLEKIPFSFTATWDNEILKNLKN